MKKLIMIFMSAFLWAANAPAQTPAPLGLEKNTSLQVELKNSIDAKKAKPGNEVTAVLTQDVLEKGKVVLPRGTKVTGHIREAQAYTKEHPESRLALVFDKILAKGGQEIGCACTVAAVAPPMMLQPASGQNDTGVPQSMGSKGNMSGGTLGGSAGSKRGPDRSTRPASINDDENNGAPSSPTGALSSGSRGVIGLEGLALTSSQAGSVSVSVVSSDKKTVKLESGTQLVILASETAKE